MTNKITNYLIITLYSSLLLIDTGCRPPMKWIENKSNYFKSTQTKNTAATIGKIDTLGTFVNIDTTCNRSTFTLMKFNSNQTVQVSNSIKIIANSLKLSNNSYLNYLDNNVSYYYYIDEKNQFLTLERFEYWNSPWWNFFVQNKHYLVEKFFINGDTLTNQITDRFSRFSRQYLLDKNLTRNFDSIHNEFIKKPE